MMGHARIYRGFAVMLLLFTGMFVGSAVAVRSWVPVVGLLAWGSPLVLLSARLFFVAGPRGARRMMPPRRFDIEEIEAIVAGSTISDETDRIEVLRPDGTFEQLAFAPRPWWTSKSEHRAAVTASAARANDLVRR